MRACSLKKQAAPSSAPTYSTTSAATNPSPRTISSTPRAKPCSACKPYTRQTDGVLRSLAGLKPQTLAVMHGSSYTGDCDRLLTDLAGVIKENFDQ